MNFTPFSPTLTPRPINKSKLDDIYELIKKDNMIKLKNDYLGTFDFFYDTQNKTMYELNYVKPELLVSNDKHIIELNNIENAIPYNS